MERDQLYNCLERVVNNIPSQTLSGKKIPCVSINTYMSSLIGTDNHVHVRLNKEEREALISDGAKGTMQYGKQMKEFVQLSEEMILDPEKLKHILMLSEKHCLSLKAQKRK